MSLSDLNLRDGMDVAHALLTRGMSPLERLKFDLSLLVDAAHEEGPEPPPQASAKASVFPDDPEEWGDGGDDFDLPGGVTIDG